MKALPMKVGRDEGRETYVPCEADEATHVQLKAPGPEFLSTRMIPVWPSFATGWTWNYDTERPTLTPSLLTDTTYAGEPVRCHSFVTDGRIQFLADCTHEFAGQTLDLLDVEP